jgi:hypothetical protein
VEANHKPTTARLLPLHVSANLKPDTTKSGHGVSAFLTGQGRSISTRLPVIGSALQQIGSSFPGTAAVADLVTNGPERSRIAKALLDLSLDGTLTISTLPLQVGTAASSRPRAWPLARAEAAAGLPGVTGLRHVLVALSKPALALTAQLDGTRDRIELVQWMTQAISSGSVPVAQAALGNERTAASHAATLVDDSLKQLAACAVLEPN